MTYQVWVAAAAAVAATFTLAGCQDRSGDTAPPAATSSTSVAAAPQLQPGNYPTTPQAPLGEAGANGVIIEAQRMADFVVGPWEVDPDLIAPNPTATLVLQSTAAIPLVLDPAAGPILDRHHFVNGFSTARTAASGVRDLKAVRNVVLRFPDASSASAAAAELANLPVQGTAESVAVDNHPDTHATVRDNTDGSYAVTSWTPAGAYVIAVNAQTPESRDAAALLVSKMLDLQVRRIADFVPTDPAGFAALPMDATGLFARNLPVTKQEATVNLGVWLPRAILHFQSNPIDSAKLFKAAGVDEVAVRKTKVYQAKDAAGAQLLADKTADAIGKDTTPAAGVPGLADAKCFDAGVEVKDANRFTCVATVDRYAITASSQQVADAQQQIAAQVMMLGGH